MLMKKSILFALSLAFTLVAGTALGADWYIKFSGGANLPTMDSKMQFAEIGRASCRERV